LPKAALIDISLSQGGRFHSLQMSTSDDKSREALANKDSDGVIQRLCDALKNKSVVHEPWTSGVLTLPESETTLFYERQDGTPR